MPRTTDGVVDHQPVRERTVIVAAVRVDREHLRTDLHQQHFVVGDMPQQLAFGEIGERHALCQIGSSRLRFLAHDGVSFRHTLL